METDSAATTQITTEKSLIPAGHMPVCLIVLGMAGSGKTTFVQVLKFLRDLHFIYTYNCF